MSTPIRTPEPGAGDAPAELTGTPSKPATPKRINVAVNPETMGALQKVMEREGVSLTEAVRRLIGYGDVLYKAVREEREEVLLKKGTHTRQVIIL
ncbi:hypothetical protein AB0L41_21205 [Amycolatopsis mediterranei]|uniref:hypothetical protein n=1 Tax=Amycolatopsis mediterranei TaxID=33910 RepID=UPI003424DFC3